MIFAQYLTFLLNQYGGHCEQALNGIVDVVRTSRCGTFVQEFTDGHVLDTFSCVSKLVGKWRCTHFLNCAMSDCCYFVVTLVAGGVARSALSQSGDARRQDAEGHPLRRFCAEGERETGEPCC